MTEEDTGACGRITRVSGPIVEAGGMGDCRMYEVMEVGPRGLVGEVIKVDGDVGTIQVYESTRGLQPGMQVERCGHELSLQLGPGLLGRMYDGMQNPLRGPSSSGGPFLKRGMEGEALDPEKQWQFEPLVEEGEQVDGGQNLGKVTETDFIDHFIMVPHGVSGTVVQVAGSGEYSIDQTICIVRGEDEQSREINMIQRWPARRERPFVQRESLDKLLVTGQRVVDTLFPLACGGTAAVPGDFGTGKSVLQQQLGKWSSVDVVIYVGCGERGNEMTDIMQQFAELEDPDTGQLLMDRTVLIANTSNMPVAAREISIYTGITLAEYYRDMGYDVALMADSTSRWAEALREVSSRLEEMPAEEGYPAYLSSRMARFYERAGVMRNRNGSVGSVSIIGAVSPPGGDFSEPVTQHTQRYTRCFWMLDRDLAYSRHFPAVSWQESYSEYVDDIEGWWTRRETEWPALRREAMNILQEHDELQEIVQLVGPDVLPDSQRLVLLSSEILREGFLQQDAFHEIDAYCAPEKQARLLKIILTFHRRAADIIESGAPVMRVRELNAVQQLKRARLSSRYEDAGALKDLMDQVNHQLDELEADYR